MSLGAPVAVCPGLLAEYVTLSGRLRDAVKHQSTRWNLTDRAARERLYRMLYGTRAAVEEVMLHHPARVAPLLPGRSGAAPQLTLTLLVSRIRADHKNSTTTPHDLAILADSPNARSHLHH